MQLLRYCRRWSAVQLQNASMQVQLASASLLAFESSAVNTSLHAVTGAQCKYKIMFLAVGWLQ